MIKRCCSCGQSLSEDAIFEECKFCGSREFYDSDL